MANPIFNNNIFSSDDGRAGWGSPHQSNGQFSSSAPYGNKRGGILTTDMQQGADRNPNVAEPTMSVAGTISKTVALFAIVLVTGAIAWRMTAPSPEGQLQISGTASTLFLVSLVGSLVAVLAVRFKPAVAKYAAPFYAVCEGFLIGVISRSFETYQNGIVAQAVIATAIAFMVVLGLYRSRLIRVTERMRSIVTAATMALAIFYIANLFMSFFNVSMPLIWDSGLLGIVFSLFVIGLACSNLLLDFDFIENGERMRLPRDFEWAAATGLLVTIIWLYLEILRLLSKLNRR